MMLSDKPVQFIVNTSYLPDGNGGNVKLLAFGHDSEPGWFILLEPIP
jgi:hypothetical protein